MESHVGKNSRFCGDTWSVSGNDSDHILVFATKAIISPLNQRNGSDKISSSIFGKCDEGSVAEWSKALDLGSSHFDGVGSNPTAAKFITF